MWSEIQFWLSINFQSTMLFLKQTWGPKNETKYGHLYDSVFHFIENTVSLYRTLDVYIKMSVVGIEYTRLYDELWNLC